MNALKKINYVMSGRQKVNIVILFFVILLGTLMELVGVSIILPFVQAVVSPEQAMSNKYSRLVCDWFGISDSHSFLLFMSVALIVIYILKNVYICIMNDLIMKFTYNNQKRLAHRLFDCYIKQPYIFHLSMNSSELIRNTAIDTSMFFSTVLAYLQLLTEVSVCIVLGAFLVFVDKSITIGLVVVLSFFVICYVKRIKKKIKSMGEVSRNAQADMTKWIQQAFGGVKEIKLLGREQFFLDNYDCSYQKYAESSRKFGVYSLLPRPMMEALCVSGLMGIVSIKLARGVDLSYFVPTLSVFAIAAFRMMPSAGRIAQYINNISYNRAAVDAVYDGLKLLEELQSKKEIEEDYVTDFSFDQGIYIEHLNFKYPKSNAYVLKDANLVIPKNHSIAFVGPSGAGKTTLADIILGFLKPESGMVRVDEINIHDNVKMWSKHLGYIPQTIFLTDDTLRNNIAFGLQPNEINENQIWSVLEDAQLKDFVEKLPDGLDTLVGERGARLSGGQRQRIGIARALYNNPDVLVLDEATSALDTETETAVMEAIENLSGKKTIIIIAHRLSTIENCDIIYEINNGVVISQKE